MANNSMMRPTRRDALILWIGTAGAVALDAGTTARAAGEFNGKTIVFAGWGGAYQDAERVSYCDPFAKEAAEAPIRPKTSKRPSASVTCATWDGLTRGR